MHVTRTWCALWLLGAASLPAQETSHDAFWRRERLLGASLFSGTDSSVTWNGDIVAEWTGTAGGGERRDVTGRHASSLRCEADLDRILGLHGGTVYLDYRSNRGESPGTGDFQGVTGLDALESDQLSELWYGQAIADGHMLGKLGVLDANSAFAAIDAASAFLNSSAGTSPTILGIPSWPVTAPGLELFVSPTEELTLGTGIYDGASAAPLATGDNNLLLPAGPFVIGQLGLTWPARRARLGDGRLAVGAWYSGAEFERFDGPTKAGANGLYALAEQHLWRERPREGDDGQGLRAFAFFGQADENIAEANRHYLAGLTYRGPVPGRDQDEIGVMVSHVDLSDVPAAGFAADETTIEIYAKVQLTGFSSLLASVQHIRHPSGDPRAEPVIAIGLRWEVAF